MPVLHAILKKPTNLILQIRYPNMEKCLNIGKNVGKTDFQLISRRELSLPNILLKGERHKLAHKWPSLHLYAFPLGTLLPQFVRWIREEDRCSVLLVALLWQNQSWFPEMVQLLSAVPWPIPLRRDLLSQAKGTIWHHHPRCGASIYGLSTGVFKPSPEGQEHNFRGQNAFY